MLPAQQFDSPLLAIGACGCALTVPWDDPGPRRQPRSRYRYLVDAPLWSKQTAAITVSDTCSAVATALP